MLDLTHQLAARAFAEVIEAETRAVLDDLGRFQPDGWNQGALLDPQEASGYLHRMRRAIEIEAEGHAQVYTPTEWLWYARRIPLSFFRGHLATTERADHALFETLTGLSHNNEDTRRIMNGAFIRYDISAHSMRPVARMAALAIVLSQTHAWLRRAGKGTHFVGRDNDLPEPIEDTALELAIDEFDQRVAADLVEAWHPAVNLHEDGAPLDSQPLLGIGGVEDDVDAVPGWLGPMRDAKWVTVAGSYLTLFETLGGLEASITRAGPRTSRWWDPRMPSLVLLLQALMIEVVNQSDSAGKTLPSVAYLLRGRSWLTGMLDEHLPKVRGGIDHLFPNTLPDTGHDVLEQLQGLDGELWPHRRGPVLRNCRYDPTSEFAEQFVIDVYAATQRLHEMVTVPANAGGQLVNANAARFEEAVQLTIDGSSWCPDPDLQALRRLQLKLDGKWITDLDAVGAMGDTLLIASCKNLTYSPQYDAGEYRAVRNAKTTVDSAVADLASIVETLTANPLGANYNLTRFDQILGVVVTPHVFFTESLRAREIVAEGPGAPLRRASSLGEVARFLAG